MIGFPYGLGVGAPQSTTPDGSKAAFRCGAHWYFDWHWTSLTVAGYVPMVYRRVIDDSRDAMHRIPNRVWLALNEPERPGQANLSGRDAVSVMLDMIGEGCWLVGPNVCFTDDKGKEWLEEFGRVGGSSVLRHPQMMAFGCHIYHTRTGDDFNHHLNWIYRWLDNRDIDLPVIVTETAAVGHSVKDNEKLVRHVGARVKLDSRLYGAAWFSTRYKNDYKNGNLLAGEVGAADNMAAYTKVGKAFKESA